MTLTKHTYSLVPAGTWRDERSDSVLCLSRLPSSSFRLGAPRPYRKGPMRPYTPPTRVDPGFPDVVPGHPDWNSDPGGVPSNDPSPPLPERARPHKTPGANPRGLPNIRKLIKKLTRPGPPWKKALDLIELFIPTGQQPEQEQITIPPGWVYCCDGGDALTDDGYGGYLGGWRFGGSTNVCSSGPGSCHFGHVFTNCWIGNQTLAPDTAMFAGIPCTQGRLTLVRSKIVIGGTVYGADIEFSRTQRLCCGPGCNLFPGCATYNTTSTPGADYIPGNQWHRPTPWTLPGHWVLPRIAPQVVPPGAPTEFPVAPPYHDIPNIPDTLPDSMPGESTETGPKPDVITAPGDEVSDEVDFPTRAPAPSRTRSPGPGRREDTRDRSRNDPDTKTDGATRVPPVVRTIGDVTMISRPPGAPHRLAPPRPRTKERKLIISTPKNQLNRVISAATEAGDVVKCLHDALPKDKQAKRKKYKDKDGNWRRSKEASFKRQASAVIRNASDIDLPSAIGCMVIEEAKDRLIAAGGRKLAQAARRAGSPTGYQLGGAGRRNVTDIRSSMR